MGKSVRASQKSHLGFKNRPLMVAGGIGCLALIGLTSWWWRHPPVDLDQRSYDVTLALCRVCNQRSVEGLDRIENELTDSENISPPVDRAYVVLATAIEKARSGRWRDAERDCRKLLEDQVRR